MKNKFIYFTAIVSFFLVVWHQCAKGASIVIYSNVGDLDAINGIACCCLAVTVFVKFIFGLGGSSYEKAGTPIAILANIIVILFLVKGL